ncbi:chalcone isomerase family protein [Litoribacillus peritrichatus]|uniref:Chalcone isomerase domain-containing protein n=1 Tax=Litoribacillus peritrichatus TaxID=718191 RepID=A0ABP7N9S0_9GAMM
MGKFIQQSVQAIQHSQVQGHLIPTDPNTHKSRAKHWLTSLIATVCFAYGSTSVAQGTEYWPPSSEVFTENSMSVTHIGSAMRYHSSKPVYIASLYSQDSFPNTAVLYSNDGAKELQLIVMDESMSYRRFKRILRDDYLITLSEDEYTKLQPKITTLLTSLKSDFRVGSLVTIAYDSLRDATILRLDGKRKSTIDGKELFNATLRAMVGERAPSREFKESLLGQRLPIIDISMEQEILLTQYMDRRLNKHDVGSSTKQEWVVNSDIDG